MVGFPARNNEDFYHALSNLEWGTNINEVKYYDAQNQQMKDGFGVGFVVGRGYWFYITEVPYEGYWEVPWT